MAARNIHGSGRVPMGGGVPNDELFWNQVGAQGVGQGAKNINAYSCIQSVTGIAICVLGGLGVAGKIDDQVLSGTILALASITILSTSIQCCVVKDPPGGPVAYCGMLISNLFCLAPLTGGILGLIGSLDGYDVSVITLSTAAANLSFACCCCCIVCCSSIQAGHIAAVQEGGRYRGDEEDVRARLMQDDGPVGF